MVYELIHLDPLIVLRSNNTLVEPQHDLANNHTRCLVKYLVLEKSFCFLEKIKNFFPRSDYASLHSYRRWFEDESVRPDWASVSGRLVRKAQRGIKQSANSLCATKRFQNISEKPGPLKVWAILGFINGPTSRRNRAYSYSRIGDLFS